MFARGNLRWWNLWVAGWLMICLGCAERQLAPEASFDSENASALRDSFDNYYQPDN